MTSYRMFLVVFLFFSIFQLSSCANQKMKALQDFDEKIKSYHSLMKYNQLEEASAFIDPEIKEDFFPVAEALLEKANFSGIRVRSVEMDEERKKATVTILRDLIDTVSYEVKTETIVQKWEKKKGRWMIVGGDF